jgi:hypothetical protein
MENDRLVELRGRGAGKIAFSSHFKQPCPRGETFSNGGGHMNKILLTIPVLLAVGSFAGLAMAQGKQGEAFGSEVSPQCAHRRVMAPDPHNDCVRKLRSDAQLGYGQGDGSPSSSDQRDEEQPKIRREQPKTSTSPKVATAPAPKAKKANTPPRLAAQKEQQLYQEFLEWRNRRLFYQ